MYSQDKILLFLKDGKKFMMKDIAKKFGFSIQLTSALCYELESLGLVKIESKSTAKYVSLVILDGSKID